MNYKYVKGLVNVNPTYSSAVGLWKHLPSSTYYVSYDFPETMAPSPKVSYMLLSDVRESERHLERLSPNAKQLTSNELSNGTKG